MIVICRIISQTFRLPFYCTHLLVMSGSAYYSALRAVVDCVSIAGGYIQYCFALTKQWSVAQTTKATSKANHILPHISRLHLSPSGGQCRTREEAHPLCCQLHLCPSLCSLLLAQLQSVEAVAW